MAVDVNVTTLLELHRDAPAPHLTAAHSHSPATTTQLTRAVQIIRREGLPIYRGRERNKRETRGRVFKRSPTPLCPFSPTSASSRLQIAFGKQIANQNNIINPSFREPFILLCPMSLAYSCLAEESSRAPPMTSRES